jgi:hypothetical protein
MHRHGLPLAIVLGALIVGCGPEKELPPTVVQPNTTRGIAPDPLGEPPTASEPEAKAVLDRAVKAITRGDPSRIAKLKTSVATYKGGIHVPNVPSMVDATLRLQALWPDHVLVKYELRAATMTFGLTYPTGWKVTGLHDDAVSPTELGGIIYGGVMSQYGISLGLPLADPLTIAAQAREVPGGTSVRVAAPRMTQMLVTFDEKTHLPIRVEHNPIEYSARVIKVITFSGHEPRSEFVIPTAIELTQNGAPAEKWTLEKWEFPEKIDPAVFEAPK